MQGRKQFRKLRQLLCLLLAVLLVYSAVPIESAFASETETEATEAESDSQTGDEEEAEAPEEDSEGSGEEAEAPEEDSEDSEAEETEPETDTNSISGMLWYDENDDGVRDNGEPEIANYPVSLYKADDTSNAVQTATTDTDGKYEFTEMESGTYVVGVKSNQLGTDHYLLPLVGVKNDNKLGTWSSGWDEKYTDTITVAADTVITDMDAGMRTPPGIQLTALMTYTINIGSATLATDIVSIPGVTYASNVLTFDSTVDPTDNYVITGTTTTNTIAINTGSSITANITLQGVDIQTATSPIQLSGTAAKVNLIVDGVNNLKCTGALNVDGAIQAGIRVPPGRTLTIDEASGGGSLTVVGGQRCAGIGGCRVTATPSAAPAANAAGTIIINGGTIDARATNGAASIGGGNLGNSGNITINGGTVTTSGNSNSVGIGNGSGNDIIGVYPTLGTITINGGEVTATGANGGIGAALYGSGGTIIITGGEVTATGGNTGAPGIGGSNTPTPALTTTVQIDAAAKVKAYSRNSTYPAIRASSITGTGYYFNGYLTSGALSASQATTLDVCPIGSATPVETLTLPANYISFAYTTGSVSETNNIRVYDSSSNILGAIVYTATEDWNIVTDIATTSLQQVKLGYLVSGILSHSNVTDSAADLTSTGHSFTIGTMDAATAFHYNDTNVFTSPSDYTTEYWTAPGASPYTSNLTGLDSNTMYYYRVYLKNQYADYTSAVQQFLTLPKIDDTKWDITTSMSPANVTITGNTGSIVASQNGQSITGVTMYFNTTNSLSTATAYPLSSTEYTDTTFNYSLPTTLVSTLTPGTTYYVWMVASNTTGTLGGDSAASMKTFKLGYTVTEIFEKFGGGRVDSSGLPDNPVTVTGSYTASGIPTSYTIGSDTYTYLGYKFDTYSPGNTLNSGTPSAETIASNRDVYYVYGLLVDVAVSKTVTGAYGDPNKEFEVTITLTDTSGAPVAGSYNYTGSAISGVTPPASSSIIFNASGQGTIRLKHGQTITIEDIPQSYTYTVQETDAAIMSGTYTAAYSGTGTVSGSGLSTVISQTLGTTAATVSITNNRSTVPTTGLSGTNDKLAAVGIVTVLTVLAVAVAILWSYRRKRKCL